MSSPFTNSKTKANIPPAPSYPIMGGMTVAGQSWVECRARRGAVISIADSVELRKRFALSTHFRSAYIMNGKV